MRRNIFTSYIIRNRLNLETFFKPIIYFIEIGGTPPPRTVYETFISYSSSKTPKYLLERICNRSLKLLFLISNSIFSEDTRGDEKNPKAFLYGDNTKISSWLSRLYLDSYGPPESSFSLFFFFTFLYII